MGRMPRLVERGKKDRRLGEPREVSWEEIEALELDPRVELIRQLIPLGLAEVGRMLEEEVEQLAGQRHARKTEDDRHYRHGHNPGSVRLGGQRHPVRVPRVRGLEGEARLELYERLHWARWTRGCSARSCLGSRVVTTRPRWRQCRGRSGCRSRRCRGSSRRRPPGS